MCGRPPNRAGARFGPGSPCRPIIAMRHVPRLRSALLCCPGDQTETAVIWNSPRRTGGAVVLGRGPRGAVRAPPALAGFDPGPANPGKRTLQQKWAAAVTTLPMAGHWPPETRSGACLAWALPRARLWRPGRRGAQPGAESEMVPLAQASTSAGPRRDQPRGSGE